MFQKVVVNWVSFFGIAVLALISASTVSAQITDAELALDQKLVEEKGLVGPEIFQVMQFFSNNRSGYSQEEVRAQLGEPFYSDTVTLGARWAHSVRVPSSVDFSMACVLLIEFDELGVTRAIGWQKTVCKLLFDRYVATANAQQKNSVEVFTLMSDVLFSFNQYQLSMQGQQALDDFIDQLLVRYKNPIVTITGHSDGIGDHDANVNVSLLRAKQVAHQFMKKGISKQNVAVSGMGDSIPVVLCENQGLYKGDKALMDCLAPNRRVEIEVYESP